MRASKVSASSRVGDKAEDFSLMATTEKSMQVMKMSPLGLHKCLSLAGFLTAAREAHRSTTTVPAPWAQELSQRLNAALSSSVCEENDISALKIQPSHLFVLLVVCKFPKPALPL